jgi:hypothetical protein
VNNPRKIIGVGREDFTDEVWTGVASWYLRSAYLLPEKETVSPDNWYEATAADVLQETGRQLWQLPLGSVLCRDSQLEVCGWDAEALHFGIDHNTDELALKRAERKYRVSPKTIESVFQARVVSFLGELGISREVVDCPHVWADLPEV